MPTRIAFICGASEPEKNGLSDYTRLLASALMEQRCEVEVIAVSDPFISEAIQEKQSGVATYRLPSSSLLTNRMQTVRSRLNEFQADHVCLNYVPFAYHSRGLPYTFLKHLHTVASSENLHWMCHELWCGLGPSPSLKEKVLGFAQRWLLQKFIKRATSISTSNPFYQKLLTSVTGKEVHLLPLFGNLTGSFQLSDQERAHVRQKNCPPLQSNELLFVLFGRIPDAFIEQGFLNRLDTLLLKAGLKGHILSIGRLDSAEDIWNRTLKHPTKCISFKRLGELPDERVSEIICAADFGLAPTPLNGVGKSGTATAMLERGLPVIGYCFEPAQIGIAPDLFPREQIIPIDDLSIDSLRQPPRFAIRPLLPEVAKMHLQVIEGRASI